MVNLFILIILSVLAVVLGILGLRTKNILATPTINPILFYLGKISLFIPLFFLFLQSLNFNLSFFKFPYPIVADIIFDVGALIFLIALIELGSSLRVGIPEETTVLKTTGIYTLSRNPIYLGLFIMIFASCLIALNPFNWIFAINAIIIHHHIILAEEKFLEKRFGEEWKDYKTRVRRYI